MANKPVDNKQTKKTTKKAVEIKETKEAKTTKKVNITDKKEDKKYLKIILKRVQFCNS